MTPIPDPDRAIQELAGKASGKETYRADAGVLFLRTGAIWCPLDDDAQALRLAVTLLLDIRHVCDEVSVCGLFGEWYTEPVFDDRLPALRRAIVRAAASIGKLMP